MVHAGLDGEGWILEVIEEIVSGNVSSVGLARYSTESVDQPFPTSNSALCHKLMSAH